MEKLFLTAAAVLLLLTSCSNPVVYYSVWSGNTAYTAGDYQKANTAYLKAVDGQQFSEYIHYNIGNVYYALGEATAADEEWEKALFSANGELLFRTLFNRGVLEFEIGRYEDAFNSFRKALEIDSSNINAKINLEYSFRRMNANSNPRDSSAAGAEKTDGDGDSDEIQRILEFIKRKDASMWSVREEKNIETGVNDW